MISCTATWVIMQDLPNTSLLILHWISNPNWKGIIWKILATKCERTLSGTSIQKKLFSFFPVITCRSAMGWHTFLQHAREKNTHLICQETVVVNRALPESPRHYRHTGELTEPNWSDLGSDQVAGYLGTLEKATKPRNSDWIKRLVEEKKDQPRTPNVSEWLIGLQTVFSVIIWLVFDGSRGILTCQQFDFQSTLDIELCYY